MTLSDEAVSRRHARIYPYDGRVAVQDLGSTNGTYVNNQPIGAPREIVAGDRVRVGLAVIELRTQQQVAARPSAVQPIPPISAVDRAVLQPAAREELQPAPQAALQAPRQAPAFAAEESEPAFVPRLVLGDAEAQAEYAALARRVDTGVKRRRNVAMFALLAVAALALLIFFGAQ